MAEDDRSRRLAEIERCYPRPQVARGVSFSTTQQLADIWWLLDQLALCERTIVRLATQRAHESARAVAAEARATELSAQFDPARMMDVFFNGRKA